VLRRLAYSGGLTEHQNSWLDQVGEVAASILPGEPGETVAPITFLLGAGASLSSGAPETADILKACRRSRPALFPTDDDVYEKFSTRLTSSERNKIIRPLFRDVEPYIGYRCLASMARSRPIFVVDLNWDSCVKVAGECVGVEVRSFDLADVAKGRQAIEEARREGCGVVSAHVHGYLDQAEDSDSEEEVHGIRFSRPDTLAFEAEELRLLQELLAHFTIVVGTSLVGPRDVHELLQALLPATAGDPAKRGIAEALWVFERGEYSRAPGFESEIAVGLSNALLARQSIDNYVSDPDVDFDMMLATLRADEVGAPWSAVVAESQMRLPALEELVPPDPKCVRHLLNENNSLIVGAPHVGSSTLAYLAAWWHCIVDHCDHGDVHVSREVKGLRGQDQVLSYLQTDDWDDTNVGAVVIDDLFEDRDTDESETQEVRKRLREAIEQLGDRRVIATASPDGTLAAACKPPWPLQDVLKPTVVWASSLWRPDDLRAWARARGGVRAEIVCREIRMGLVSTPSQAVRTLEGHPPHELEQDWRTRLKRHLDMIYGYDKPHALLLAMLRLQDFSIPKPESFLAHLAGLPDSIAVVNDPWGLCMPIEVDGDRYLRLTNPGVVSAVDDWIETGREILVRQLRKMGEVGNWAVASLHSWDVFRKIDASHKIPSDLDGVELELFGSEYVRRALQNKNPELALDALWRTWGSVRDYWTAKDVALDLVLNWEVLKTNSDARRLRDSLLKARAEMGAYALFEAVLRAGRPVSIELWTSVVSRILDLAALTQNTAARRQVALSFDALLWRRSPGGSEQERKLIQELQVAAHRDERLHAAFATACAYHFKGAERLRTLDFNLSLQVGTDVTLAAAKEMAWLVAWHFAHQSRCRAVASRRIFLSTVDVFVDSGAPRYLDRSVRKNELDADHKSAVMRIVEALLRHRETAGWALHLLMNIHATTGNFRVPEAQVIRFDELLDPKTPDIGVVSAALTYMPADQIRELLKPFLGGEVGNDALQAGLGLGVTVEGIQIAEPRFVMGGDPWAIRDRWRVSPRNLPFGMTDVLKVIEGMANQVDGAVDGGLVDQNVALQALERLRRGQTAPIEVRQHQRKLEGDNYMELLVFVCKYFEAADDDE